MKRALSLGLWVIVALIALIGVATAQQGMVPENVWKTARAKGVVHVIVTFHPIVQPGGKLSQDPKDATVEAISATQQALIEELAGTRFRVTSKGRISNFIALEAGIDALSVLESSRLVFKVQENRRLFWSRTA